MASGGGGIARARLMEERKSWRKSHPHGFVAKQEKLPDGTANLMVWNCVVPGKGGIDWEGGYFPLTLHFSEVCPTRPPVCKFPPGFFHVNVYPTGAVCLSVLGMEAFNHFGIQELFDHPNPASAAQDISYQLFRKNKAEYKKRVREQAKLYPSRV